MSLRIPLVIERQHFDAFGLPLKTNSLAPSIRNAVTTEKGYTGHDMLTDFGLINMNARLYDPALGRFLSPDTFVQSMLNTQALNRYSYVLNSPLNYTDPSGHFFLEVAQGYHAYKWAKANPKEAIILASIAATAATAGATSPWLASVEGAIESGFLSGAAGGVVSGGLSAAYHGENVLSGSIRGGALGGLMGGISGGVMYGAGQLGASAAVNNNSMVTPLIHGAAGVGIGAIRNNGSTKNWKADFVSAAVSKIASNNRVYNYFAKDNYVGNAMLAGAIGGTVSDRTGGNFANGARTAAFGQLFNAMGTGVDPDIGGYSPVAGEYFNENGELLSVDVADYGGLVSSDGLTSYDFDHRTGTLINPRATGSAESVCPSCYLIGGGSVKFTWGALKSSVIGTLSGPRVGHRLFTTTRKNGTWNTGKYRFGWSGKNGSDVYEMMFRYKQHHIPTGVKTTRVHPSGG